MGTLAGVNLLIFGTLLAACGSKSDSATSETPTAPADLVGVYQHPVGEGDQDRRLTITPTGMSVTGNADSTISWASGSGSSASGWNFTCTEQSQRYCGRGSLMRTAQGLLTSVSDGRISYYGNSYAGVWVPVGPSTSTTTAQRVTSIPTWMHGEWVRATSLNTCTLDYRVSVRSSSATVTRKARPGRTASGRPCSTFDDDEETYPALEGEVRGNNVYRVGNHTFELDGDRLLVSFEGQTGPQTWRPFFLAEGTWQRP
jgi:hypothetical protein